LGREIRHATRRLVQSPVFTIASILTLALGLGSNTAIFSVVERVLLNPLPYPDSNRLIVLDHGATTSSGRRVPSGIQMSVGLYHHHLERPHTLESVALYTTGEQTLTDRGEPERIRVARVTPSLASVMQVPPLAGRWFAADEGAPAAITTPRVQPASQTAVFTYRLWTSRYGGEHSLVSRTVILDGVPTEVVGIMPPRFACPDAPASRRRPPGLDRGHVQPRCRGNRGRWVRRDAARSEAATRPDAEFGRARHREPGASRPSRTTAD
jgi:hypothetical protein